MNRYSLLALFKNAILLPAIFPETHGMTSKRPDEPLGSCFTPTTPQSNNNADEATPPAGQSTIETQPLAAFTFNSNAIHILIYIAATFPYWLCKNIASLLNLTGQRLANAIQALRRQEKFVHCLEIPTGLKGKKPLLFAAQPHLYERLGLPIPRELSQGKGSELHRALQHLNARSIPDSEVEMNVGNGKVADLGWKDNGEVHVIEIQLSGTVHLIENIERDLAAGVTNVHVLFGMSSHLKKATQLIKRELTSEQLTKVNLDVTGNWLDGIPIRSKE